MILRSSKWFALGLVASAGLSVPPLAAAADGLPTLDGKPPLVVGHRACRA